MITEPRDGQRLRLIFDEIERQGLALTLYPVREKSGWHAQLKTTGGANRGSVGSTALKALFCAFFEFAAGKVPRERCSDLSATWCPNCGDCSCLRHDDGELMQFDEDGVSIDFEEGCPLHDERSPHPIHMEAMRLAEQTQQAAWLRDEPPPKLTAEEVAELHRKYREWAVQRRQELAAGDVITLDGERLTVAATGERDEEP